MRLLTCALALTVATTTVATTIAAACGGSYGEYARPHVVLVSQHSIPGQARRSFAVLGETEVGSNVTWTRLAPMSYDPTEITALATSGSPMTLTLVGMNSSRVVTAEKRFVLRDALWIMDSRFEAIELPLQKDEEVVIALRGAVRNAAWRFPEYRHDGTISLTRGFVATRDADSDKPQFQLSRDNNIFVGRYPGSVLGVLTANGKHYVVAENQGRATAILLP